MPRSRLARIDLNLLVPLEALLREMSVTRAATRLGVTQSATSHALGRLRTLFDDPLLVRKGGEMTRTAFAERLATELGTALENMERILDARSTFDPSREVRSFTVIAGDYASTAIVAPLLARIGKKAPGVRVVVRSVAEPERALLDREYSLMLGPARAVPHALRRQLLFTDELVCVARRNHPALRATLDEKKYLAATHVLVSPRGLPGGIVDDALAARGLERRVALEVPSFLSAAMVVADSDLLLTMPSRLAERLAPRFSLSSRPVPFETPPIEFVQLWHERHQGDSGHAWFRGQVAAVAHERNEPDS